jgi:outer membrane receptor protein involved in Fe transport
MRFTKRGVVGLLSAAVLLSLSPLAYGQAVYGSVFGTVVDTTGAAVPGATIVVTDEAKGTSVTVTSNASGEFTAEHLIPDSYDVKVTAKGFKGYEQKGIILNADTSTKIEAALTVGGSDQTVEVDADAVPQLKTDRADVSTIFGAKEIQDLPVGDRNFTNLQLLLPGAQLLGWSHAPDENPQGSRQIQVDGQAFGGVAFELDGTDNQDPILGIIVINPNIDSLSESKISTQNFDAEFGKAVSSVVTAQTKSGSNSFHGSLFDYRTSTANLAKDPYLQFPGSPIAPGLKNQFGGSIGGPIFKNRFFFFGDYQGARQRVGSSAETNVPSALVTSSCLTTQFCNLSEYTNFGGPGNGIVYQPNGTPYPGNMIPISQVSQSALNYLKLLAPFVPNKASTTNSDGTTTVDTYAQGGTGIFNSDQWDVRLDYQVTQRAHAFVRFSRFTDTLSGSTLLGAAGGPGFGLGGYGGNSKGANDSLATGMDIAVSNSLVTDFRLGYYRYDIVDQKYNQGTAFADNIGFGGLNIAGNNFTSGAPGFVINQPGSGGSNTQYQGLWGAGLSINRCNCPLTEKEDQFQVVNNWTKTIGNHSIKFGADLRYARNLRVPSDTDRTGLFTFNQLTTSLGGSGGLGLASFLLGEPGQFGRYVSTSTNAKEFQKRDFFYAQDTWRASNKLTLNLGLRYELYFPESVNGPGNGSLMDLYTGYLHVAGIGGVPSDMGWQKATNAYNPRIGLAYSATDKTVVRAGYGRSFDLGVFGSIFGHVVTQNLPVLANQEISGPGDATAYAQPFNIATGPPAYVPPAVPSDGLLPNPGYAVNSKARPNSLRLPTIDAWNLSIQQSLTPTFSLTMAYVGNKGTHTLSAGDGNNTNPNESAIFLPAQYSVTGQTLHYDPTVKTGISPAGGTSNVNYLTRYYGGTLPACQDPAYTPQAGVPAGACGWTQGISWYGDNQNTHFNALQVSVAKQYTHGVSLNVNYAWQRGFNVNSGYATWSEQAAYGRDDSIREQQVVAYGIFQLPFGRNKMFLSGSPRFLDEIVGGWQLSPVLNLSSGLPFTLGMNNCGDTIPQGGQSAVPCYPDGNPRTLKTGLSPFNVLTHNRTFYQSVDSGVNNLCSYTDSNGVFHPGTPAGGFSCPAVDTIGNTGRNSVFGPGFFNTDLSLQKNFPIKESLFAQFRVDFANVFNHINAGNPGGNIDSTGTIGNGTGGVGVANPRQLTFSGRVQF